MILSASYIIDELLDKETIKDIVEKSYFELQNMLPINEERVNQYGCILNKIISRGNPTRASKIVIESLLDIYKVKYELVYGRTFVYSTDEIDNNIQVEIQESLITIAQIQKSLAVLLLSNNISNDSIIVFKIPLQLQEITQIAIKDFKHWIKIIDILTESESNYIKNYSLNALDESNEINICVNSKEYIIKATTSNNSACNKKNYTTGKIKYKSIGDFNIEGEMDGKFSEEKQQALLYCLQSLFRKSEYNPGQLRIINRALQGLSVVGILPTGGGKSLAYQLVTLLQPTITLIIDPINSLMRDQHEKLLENFIDNTSFINIYNDEQEKNENERKLVNGESIFTFISPERLQIKKFRDKILKCEQNNTHFGYAVVDEAHCVSEWGHDFRQVYLNLATNLNNFLYTAPDDKLNIIALTATASYDVLTDIRRELKLDKDDEQSLPPKSIDREELKYYLLKIDADVPKYPNWLREKQLARFKYPTLKKYLRSKLPQLLKTSFEDFYEKDENKNYPNAGIIFCNTKSDARGDGVWALRYYMRSQSSKLLELEGLRTEEYLEKVTFLSGGDQDQRNNSDVDSLAKESFDNQGLFIDNKANLMIATKAFGMGIDKPNVRYTIHYGLPNSIESFYQEAGRAGRDRNPAVCSILFHEDDNVTSEEFLKNSFKGFPKEQATVLEFLNEVRYENKFFIQWLTQETSERFPEVDYMKLNHWKEDIYYLNINGKYKKNIKEIKKFGALKIKKNTIFIDLKDVNIVDKETANEVLKFVKTFIESNAESDYISWLNKSYEEGIEKQLERMNEGEEKSLLIGFENDYIPKVRKILEEKGYFNFKSIEGIKEYEVERIIRAAHNFCESDEQFVNDKLPFEYERFVKEKIGNSFLPKTFPIKLNISIQDNETCDFLKDAFWKIRNIQDTQRGIYRLNILGVIEDYTLDYANRFVTVKFKKKSPDEYKNKFEKYLRRYEGDEKVQEWLEKTDQIDAESSLQKYLKGLMDFIYKTIKVKRESAITYMKNQCLDYFDKEDEEKGELIFRENIVYYFTSKYAGNEWLPQKSKNDTLEVVKEFLKYMNEPPLELGIGGQIDNFNHLKGATVRVLSENLENKCAKILRAFSTFLIETYNQDIDVTNHKSREFDEAKSDFVEHFTAFSEKYSYEDWSNYLEHFKELLISINGKLKLLVEQLEDECYSRYWNQYVNKLINRIVDIKI
jgi:ATP-dependent DNA helicase RecQ